MIQSWLPASIASEPDGATVSVRGVVADVERHVTRQGRDWLTARLDTGDGSVRLLVFPKTYDTHAPLIVDGARVTVTGRMDRRDDVPRVLALEVTPAPTIEELIERSSFGTPEAVAMRATVSDEAARRCVARARELGAMGGRS